MKNVSQKIATLFSVSLLFGIFFTMPLFAQAATGTINANHANALVCHDPSCTNPTPGILNWNPTQPAQDAPVIDDQNGLRGYIWGNELGWINLNQTGGGVSINATTGALTGRAWSQVSGWINFNPTSEGVTVDPTTGEFSGWAWTGGPSGGWIKFDCSSPSSCVSTTWRAASATSTPPVTLPPSSGGGGGLSSGGSVVIQNNASTTAQNPGSNPGQNQGQLQTSVTKTTTVIAQQNPDYSYESLNTFTKSGKSPTKTNQIKSATSSVLAFPFVSEKIQLPATIDHFGVHRVDLISVGIAILAIVILTKLFFMLFR